ncbi:transposase [Streptomyces sp.]|uniref:transposase n=1 Tax=Streptomyces sp. TaxID=1931 RepID=UPI0025EAFCDF|nr:transposase [Streptomyces sp.]
MEREGSRPGANGYGGNAPPGLLEASRLRPVAAAAPGLRRPDPDTPRVRRTLPRSAEGGDQRGPVRRTGPCGPLAALAELLWRDEGTEQDVHDLLRWQLREKRKRLADRSLVVLDTQSVHASVGVPATTTGRDAAKKVPGRKRCLAVDVLGLVIDCVVLPASAHDNTAGIALLDGVAEQCDTVTKALVDQGFKKKVVEHGENVGIDVEIVERTPDDKGFVPQAKRWIVEQTNGIMMFYRRLVRDYEHRPASSRSRVLWAMTSVMSRRLTGATIASWRTA